jgi:hypothetical protein
VTADTADLDVLTGASTVPHDHERLKYGSRMVRNPEVRPIEVAVLPRWLPLGVEIQAVVRWPFTFIRVSGVEGGSGHRDPIWKDD